MIYFIGDFHLGHRSILKHTKAEGSFRGGSTVDEHDEWVIERCLSVHPDKRTCWYILGDVAMERAKLQLLNRLPGKKWLVLGNHDKFESVLYLQYFDKLMGSHKKYKILINHIQLHPAELKGHFNIHGHSHDNATGNDHRYLNVSIEYLPNYQPISLEQVRTHWSLPQ